MFKKLVFLLVISSYCFSETAINDDLSQEACAVKAELAVAQEKGIEALLSNPDLTEKQKKQFVKIIKNLNKKIKKNEIKKEKAAN